MEELIRKQPGAEHYRGYTEARWRINLSNTRARQPLKLNTIPNGRATGNIDFLQDTNPTTLNRQGTTSAVPTDQPYSTPTRKKTGSATIEIVNASGRWKAPVVTTLEPLKQFYAAEDYHQDYLQKNPAGYTCHLVYFDSYLK